MKHTLLILFSLLATLVRAQLPAGQTTFSISFPVARSSRPLDGRVLLILAKTDKPEPRFQVSDAVETAQVFDSIAHCHQLKKGLQNLLFANPFLMYSFC